MGAKRQLDERPMDVTIRIPAHLEQEIRAKAASLDLSFDDLVGVLLRHGIEYEAQKENELDDLVDRFRSEEDEATKQRLGDELGRALFG